MWVVYKLVTRAPELHTMTEVRPLPAAAPLNWGLHGLPECIAALRSGWGGAAGRKDQSRALHDPLRASGAQVLLQQRLQR